MSLFYKLSIETIDTILTAGLSKSTQNLLWYVCKLNPFSDQTIEITWEKAKEAIKISKATFYRALAKLVNSGLLVSRKISGFCVSLKNETTFSEMKIESQNCGFQSQNCDSSLYIDLQTDQTFSEGKIPEKTAETPESDKTISPNLSVTAKVIQTATVDPISQGKDKLSAACTKKSTKGKNFNWLPDGPWNIEGKLDPNFRDFIANDWLKRFGGDIHAKRADVLAHFKKDPANLPIRWEQYQSEFLNRVQNTQILLSNGIEVKPETQDKLLTNHRALTAELPAEMNPVAPIAETSPTIAAEVAALPETPSKNSITSPKPLVKSSALPETPSKNSSEEIVTEDGQRLKVFQRPEVEEDDRDPGKLRSMVNSFLKGFASGQTPSKKFQAQTELEKLNAWLNDPLLRDNTIAFANRSESFKYCPDLDQIIEASEF